MLMCWWICSDVVHVLHIHMNMHYSRSLLSSPVFTMFLHIHLFAYMVTVAFSLFIYSLFGVPGGGWCQTDFTLMMCDFDCKAEYFILSSDFKLKLIFQENFVSGICRLQGYHIFKTPKASLLEMYESPIFMLIWTRKRSVCMYVYVLMILMKCNKIVWVMWIKLMKLQQMPCHRTMNVSVFSCLARLTKDQMNNSNIRKQ